MQSSFVAAVISVVLCFKFRANQCLLNVAFSMTKALNDWNFPKQNFYSLHLSVPSFPPSHQCHSENPASNVACFSFFHNPFLFQTLWNFNWLHSNWDFGFFRLIKYNRLQISENKSYKTPYSFPWSIILKK